MVAADFNGQQTSLLPNHIKANLNSAYRITVNYHAAWRAKDATVQLLRGVLEDSFRDLPSYFWLLEKANPGTMTFYDMDCDNRFKSCFVAFGPSVNGIRGCIRPVIAIDATHLKGKYTDKLILATAQDANNQIYPLAFGVARTENDEAWTGFFEKLRHVVGQRDDLVIISDRHRAIEGNVHLVFPEAKYGICMVHLGRNMQAKYKMKPEEFLYKAAKAYTTTEFNDVMNALKIRSIAVYDYLMQADPTKWARIHFKGRTHKIMSTNIRGNGIQ